MDHKESFLKYLQTVRRYSPLTVRSYVTDLDQFYKYQQESGNQANDVDVTSGDVRSWIVHLLETGNKPVSIHRKISSLRSYFRYLRREGFVGNDPFERVVLPKTGKRLPVFIEEHSMEKVLDGLDFGNDFRGCRDKMVIEMLYMTGMRRAELTGLRDGDVDLAEGIVRVTGKRNKQRIIPLTKSFTGRLGEYRRLRNDAIADGGGGWFFVGNKGNKLYDKNVYIIVRNYLSMATTIEKKSPHVLRHTFATHMLNNGADLNSIKEFLGHANLAATQVYTHNSFEKLRKIYKQAHPRA